MHPEIIKVFQTWRHHFLTEPNREKSQQSEREFITICGKYALDYRAVHKYCREWYQQATQSVDDDDDDDNNSDTINATIAE